jgi:hypothetical protein
MTHDDFLRQLTELDPARVSGTDSLSDLLTPEAAAHAKACANCERTAEAILLVARDGSALGEAPPEIYWQDFNERLLARLPSVAPPEPRSASLRGLLRAAAVLIVVTALAAFVLDGLGSPETPDRADGLDDYEEALAAWSDEPAWTLEPPPGELALALPESDEDLSPLLASPDDALLEELSLELDDAQAAELARRLRAEISS